jgi:hypothetical protein
VVLGIADPIAGEIVNDFKAAIKNKKRDDVDSFTERYVSNILAAHSFGLLDSSTLKGLVGGYGESGIASTIGGPSAGDAVKIATGVKDAAAGLSNYDPEKGFLDNVDPTSATRRNLVKEIPGVGQTIANTTIDNAYIDNQFGGVNEGLNKKDKEQYKNLQQIDPAAAEKFKAENQYSDKAKEEGSGSFLDNFFGGKKEGKASWDTKPTSKKAETEYNSMVDKALETGAEVPENALNQRFFKGKNYGKKDLSDRKDILESMTKVMNDEFLTDAQKAEIAQSAGVPVDDLEYYKMASMDAPERLQGLLTYAESGSEDRNQFVSALIQNKKVVGGKAIMDSTMVDSLYDRGLIDKEEKALINAVKYDQIYEKFYVDRDYQAKYGKGGTNDQAAAKKVASKVKAYVNSLNSLNKDSISTETKSTKASLKTPTARSIAAPKSKLKVSQPKSSGAWFKSY